MKKKKQHYVWRHYLRPWAKDEQVYCMSGGKVFLTNLMNIANENHFYRLKELTSSDIAMARKLLIDGTPKVLQDLNGRWLRIFTIVFDLKKTIEKSGKTDPRIEEELQLQIENLEEDLHSQIEQKAIPYLELLYKEDTSFYNTDKGNIDFGYYLAVQYFRTNKMKKNITGQSLGLPIIDLSAIWNVMSHVLATNLGMSLYRERESFRCVLMRNKTATPLIAGDQPVINTYGSYAEKTVLSHDELELYYPLRPDLALVLTRKPEKRLLSIVDMNANDVMTFNRSIKDAADSQVYANEAKVLEELM